MRTGAKAEAVVPCFRRIPTTASFPSADLWTKCTSRGACFPSMVCSEGVWKWNCSSSYLVPP